MYTIYADDKLLYSPNLFREGYGVFSPKLTVELNRSGSLEFVMPPNNVMYDQVKKLKTIITAYQNQEQIFRGRILDDERDFYKQKRTYCEGELSFLLDSTVRPYSMTSSPERALKYFIEGHNSRVEASKQFIVGVVDIPDKDLRISISNAEYATTLDEINNVLIGNFGGYLRTRDGEDGLRYLDWLDVSGQSNTQTIEFGRNLLDITEYISASNIITVIIPLGATKYDSDGNPTGRLTIRTSSYQKDYVESETAIALFGRIEGTLDLNDIDDVDELKEIAEASLASNIEMAVTLDVKAIDLHLLDVNVEAIHVGDWVRVISIPHGLDSYFQCTRITYDMIDPEQSEYIFGLSYTSLTDRQVSDNKVIQTASTAVKSAINSANSAANKATQTSANVETVIAQLPTEYVRTTTFDAYKTETSNTLTSLIERIEKLENTEEGGTE